MIIRVTKDGETKTDVVLQWYRAARRHGYRAIDALHKARIWTHMFATYGSRR